MYIPYTDKARKLVSIKPLTRWEDIKVGAIYHMPPLTYNKRMNLIVVSKNRDFIIYKDVIDKFGTSYTLYRNDVKSKFLTFQSNCE